jgi:hypothetical protein
MLSNADLTYRESVLLDIAMQNALFAREAAILPTLVDKTAEKMGMSESEVLWALSTNRELSEYIAAVARDVALGTS